MGINSSLRPLWIKQEVMRLMTLRQGLSDQDLGRDAKAGLWDGDGGITCFRKRLENVWDDLHSSCSCFFVILLKR